jgi:TRAP-type C4-dicarboxylate transport system permease small subunit
LENILKRSPIYMGHKSVLLIIIPGEVKDMEATAKTKSSPLDKTERVLSATSRVLSYIGTAVVVIMMLLTVGDVLGRYAFRRPIVGTLELTEYFMVIIAFFALGWCEIGKKHIKVDLFVERFSSRVRAVINCITYLLSLLVLIPIAWQNALRVGREFEIQRASTILGIPDYPFFLALVIGCVVFGLAIVLNLAKSIREAIKR